MLQQVIFRRKSRSGPAPALTSGKPYDVLDRKERYGYEMVLITNDSGKNTWYHLDDFEGYADLDGVVTLKDYEQVIKEHNRLVRELDVLLNGSNAAKQASLVDIVDQVRAGKNVGQALDLARPMAASLQEALDCMNWMWDNMRLQEGKEYLQSDAFNIPANAIDQAQNALSAFKAVEQAKGADVDPVQLSGNSEQLDVPAASDEYKYCNHHHELTPEHEVVDFGDGQFVANKMAIPLLKALNEAGLRTRSHHIDTPGQGWFTILLDNVEFDFRRVWEIDANRKKYNGKQELLISWGSRPPIPNSEIEARETPVK
ncbi:hypothetical protein [Paraflavitalea pollutisoli]|uniref:hypothetical protein n=1 Tax=Paraflavitalea pollutisoli TaxID=3034143 RepID=UPI0023ECC0C6|nr:hypothetical protein [Paraflavitalea sp. H1-2-19X]